MDTLIEKKKLKIENDKKRILLQEKLLIEQEKKKRAKRFQSIGRLMNKANLDHFDDSVLLGALLEIADRLKEEKFIRHCKSVAESYSKAKDESSSIPMVIKVKSKLNSEIEPQLKKMKFKWNHVTKDYFGVGSKTEIEDLLSGIEYKLIEVSC